MSGERDEGRAADDVTTRTLCFQYGETFIELKSVGDLATEVRMCNGVDQVEMVLDGDEIAMLRGFLKGLG